MIKHAGKFVFPQTPSLPEEERGGGGGGGGGLLSLYPPNILSLTIIPIFCAHVIFIYVFAQVMASADWTPHAVCEA